MKILQVVHSFPPHNFAGTEVYTYNLSKELAKRHQIFVFHRMYNLKMEEYRLEHNRFDGLNIFTINNTFRFCDSFEKLYRNEDIAKKFGEILDQIKPDVIHIQHLIFLSTTLIYEAKRRKIPIAFTLHDYWLICSQWHFLKKDLSVCNNNDILECVSCLDYQLSIKKTPKRIYRLLRNTLPNSLVQLLKNIYFSYSKTTSDSVNAIEQIKARISHIKELCSLVDIFIAPSQFLKRRYVEFGVPEEKITFSRPGLDADLFEDFKRKESNRIRFGFIGTILPAKGLHLLISAFNRVEDNNVELKIYGRPYPYQGFEYYPRYIKRLAKNKNIFFLGGFDNKDIAKILSEIDVLIIPSIWYENSPLVIQEAMITHTAVIASDIGGIPELVRNMQNGLLFRYGDVDELYGKLRLIIDEPNLIEQLRQNGRPVKNIEEQAIELEKIYINLISIRGLITGERLYR